MDRPVGHPVTEELYAGLQPFAQRDAEPESEWHLLRFLDRIMRSSLADVFDLVSETDADPGWGTLTNPDTAKFTTLPWLAQLVGARLPDSLSDAERRAAVRNPSGFERGKVSAMVLAAQQSGGLTGTKRVDVYERAEGNAYRIAVRTLDHETLNDAVVEAALRSAKPGGLVLDYDSIPGQTFQQLNADYDTFQEVQEAYGTLGDVLSDAP